jgi:vancomycin permeability regulator SanA
LAGTSAEDCNDPSRSRRQTTVFPSQPRFARFRLIAVIAAAMLGAFFLPLAEQIFFGSTEYRHSADVAMVLGAGIHADGTPSDALRDRVNTAIELYKSHRVRALLMTGGIDPGHGGSEPAVMKRLAVEAGVPADAIVLDESGSNTQASVRNAVGLMRSAGWRDCLVVSHDYHLPRIKRMLDREGVRSYTVPAHEARPLLMGPYYRLREIIAWHYYLLSSPPPTTPVASTGAGDN